MNTQHVLNKKANRVRRLAVKCKDAPLDKTKSERFAALTEELRRAEYRK